MKSVFRSVSAITALCLLLGSASLAEARTITRLQTQLRSGTAQKPVDKSRSRLRNEQRRTDVTTIANAIYSWKRDTKEKLPKSVPLDDTIEICKPKSKSCKGMVDLSSIFAEYLSEVPSDPLASPTANGTRYFIGKDYKDRFTISAPDAEDRWLIKKDK